MKTIPQMQADNREVNQLQNNILSVMNPILKQNPILSSNAITSVALKIGNNTIGTGLNRNLQGWILTRQRGPATDASGTAVTNYSIYDLQDSNTSANNTLILNSSANINVDLLVY